MWEVAGCLPSHHDSFAGESLDPVQILGGNMLRSRDSSPHQKGNVRFVLSVPISRTKFQRGHFEPQSIKCKFVRAGLMGTWLKEESLKKRKQAFYILQICEIFERERGRERERTAVSATLDTAV